MGIANAVLRKAAEHAFMAELNDWKLSIVAAIQNANMELLSSMPEQYKTAAWILYGMSSVNDMAPETTKAGKIISRSSAYIAVAEFMLERLHDLYKKHARKFNALLKKHHLKIRDALIEGVDKLENTISGSQIIEKTIVQIVEVTSCRISSVEMGRTMFRSGYLRQLIEEAKLLNDSDDPIVSKVQERITEISKKLLHVYEGSKHGRGEDSLYVLNYSIAECDETDRRDPFTGERTACQPYKDKISGGSTHGNRNVHDAEKFAALIAQIWKYDVHIQRRLSGHDIVHARINPHAKSPVRIIREATNACLADSKKKLAQAEPIVWKAMTEQPDDNVLFG